MGNALSNFTTRVYDITLSSLNGTLDALDVMADFEKLELKSYSDSHCRGTINNVFVVDGDDLGQELNIFMSDKADTTPPVLGTEGAAITISDADAATILGVYNIPTANYTDLVSSQVGRPDVSAPIPFNVAQNYLYIGVQGITGGATTTSGLTLRFTVTIEN
jgi:hypothetical protein